MSENFEIIQIQLDADHFATLSKQKRNQLIGCMHAHNELAVLNRLLMFSRNEIGEGLLHDHAHTAQIWCILQVLIGKVFESWKMIEERFLNSNPIDTTIELLDEKQGASLNWLKNYFDENKQSKNTPLRIIRNKTAFHYDNLNLDEVIKNLNDSERQIYLSRHPENTLYYAGSALILGSIFAKIADELAISNGKTYQERIQLGMNITLQQALEANTHLHNALYGLIAGILDTLQNEKLEDISQIRISILNSPKPTEIGLPMFIDVSIDKTIPDR